MTWDAVTVDCKGGPEAAVVYIVTQTLIAPDGFLRACATDIDTGDEVCIDRAQYAPPVRIAEDTVNGTSYPDAMVHVPPPGGVTFVDVETVDAAGNISGGTCP